MRPTLLNTTHTLPAERNAAREWRAVWSASAHAMCKSCASQRFLYMFLRERQAADRPTLVTKLADKPVVGHGMATTHFKQTQHSAAKFWRLTLGARTFFRGRWERKSDSVSKQTRLVLLWHAAMHHWAIAVPIHMPRTLR